MNTDEVIVVGTVKVELPITNEMVDGLLITAVEDGSPWLDAVYPINDQGHLTVGGHLCAGLPLRFCYEDGESTTITLDRYLDAIQNYCTERSMSPDDVYDQHDADMADLILQYALFGEAVYG